VETAPYSKDKVARYYLAATTSPAVELAVNPELGMPEHHEYRWLTFADALALVVPRLVAVLGWAQERLPQAR
jgi:bis(5'-nucleosidyl)-tetraphosphatase